MPPDTTEIFFMVYADHAEQNARSSTRKHPTYDEAVEESKRLARKHPGMTFFVLRAAARIALPIPQPEVTVL